MKTNGVLKISLELVRKPCVFMEYERFPTENTRTSRSKSMFSRNPPMARLGARDNKKLKGTIKNNEGEIIN